METAAKSKSGTKSTEWKTVHKKGKTFTQRFHTNTVDQVPEEDLKNFGRINSSGILNNLLTAVHKDGKYYDSKGEEIRLTSDQSEAMKKLQGGVEKFKRDHAILHIASSQGKVYSNVDDIPKDEFKKYRKQYLDNSKKQFVEHLKTIEGKETEKKELSKKRGTMKIAQGKVANIKARIKTSIDRMNSGHDFTFGEHKALANVINPKTNKSIFQVKGMNLKRLQHEISILSDSFMNPAAALVTYKLNGKEFSEDLWTMRDRIDKRHNDNATNEVSVSDAHPFLSGMDEFGKKLASKLTYNQSHLPFQLSDFKITNLKELDQQDFNIEGAATADYSKFNFKSKNKENGGKTEKLEKAHDLSHGDHFVISSSGIDNGDLMHELSAFSGGHKKHALSRFKVTGISKDGGIHFKPHNSTSNKTAYVQANHISHSDYQKVKMGKSIQKAQLHKEHLHLEVHTDKKGHSVKKWISDHKEVKLKKHKEYEYNGIYEIHHPENGIIGQVYRDTSGGGLWRDPNIKTKGSTGDLKDVVSTGTKDEAIKEMVDRHNEKVEKQTLKTPKQEWWHEYKQHNLNKYPANIPKEKVTVNTEGDIHSHAVMSWRDPKSNKLIQAYTKEFLQRNAQHKWDRIKEIKSDDIKLIKTKSYALLKSNKVPDKLKQAAAVVQLISMTGLRPGDHENYKKTGNRGVTTLSPNNVIIKGDEVHLSFVGKSYQQNVSIVKDASLATYLGDLKKRNGKNEFLFDIDRQDADNVFKKNFGLKNYKLKDLRTYIATDFAKDLLFNDKTPPPPLPEKKSQIKKVLQDKLKSVFEKVSQKLNNTPAMTKSSYIHPAIIESFIVSLGQDVNSIMKAEEDNEIPSLDTILKRNWNGGSSGKIDEEDEEECIEYALPDWWSE